MGTPYRKVPQFVVGDLVYFLGHDHYRDSNELGIIISADARRAYGDLLYHVFWLDRGYAGLYSGGQLLLVYEVDPQTENITLNKW